MTDTGYHPAFARRPAAISLYLCLLHTVLLAKSHVFARVCITGNFHVCVCPKINVTFAKTPCSLTFSSYPAIPPNVYPINRLLDIPQDIYCWLATEVHASSGAGVQL